MSTFLLPDLGEGLNEAEIVEWHVSEGDFVVADQPLLAVETDKAVVDVPAPGSGRVARLHARVGEIVRTGAPLVDFDDGERVDAGAVAGALPQAAAPGPRRDPARAAGTASIRATPAVRALARKLGVDLAQARPTGPGGSITARDVENSRGSGDGAASPFSGLRRAMALKMAKSHAEVVPASVHDEADIGDWPEGSDITARLVRAVAAACAAEPALNAWYDSVVVGRRLMPHVDVGIALDTEGGQLVPVLRDVAGRSVAELRAALDHLKRVAAGRAAAADLRDPTITVSNFGSLGAGRFASMVVMPPQVAIVGAGRMSPRVVARAGQAVVRRMVPLSLTFDHRAVTGGEAVKFMAALVADLQRAE